MDPDGPRGLDELAPAEREDLAAREARVGRAGDGGSSRDASACVRGSYGARSGAKTAQKANPAMSPIARTLSGLRRIDDRAAMREPRSRVDATSASAMLDPRVEPVIGDVNREVRDGIDDRREQGHPEHCGEVEAHRGGGRVTPEARPAEDRFGEHRA